MRSNEFLAFSEAHMYKRHNRSVPLEDGRLTTWVAHLLDAIDQVFRYADQHKVLDIIFGGDLFEEKNRIPQDLYNLVWEYFEEKADYFSITFNTGNHDIYARNRDSSLRPFSTIVSVVTEPEDIIINKNLIVTVIPYGMATPETVSTADINRKEEESGIDRKLVLFLHEDILGLEYSNRFKSQSGLMRQLLSGWDVVFNGHIHKAQTIGNIINMGSMVRHDFGEQDKKYFYHYKDGLVKHIEIECPEFITVGGLTKRVRREIGGDNYNFYRIDISAEELSDPIFQKYNVVPNVVKTRSRDKRITEDMTMEEEITRYVELSETDLDKEKLIRIGKEIAGC